MSEELKQALAWALTQNYPSVAARHARTIAEAYMAYVRMSADLATRQFVDALSAGGNTDAM